MPDSRPLVWVGEPDGFSKEAKSILESHTQVVYQQIDETQLETVFDQCDVFLFRLGLRILGENMKADQRCKIIATPVTGLDHIDLSACMQNNIRIISLHNETEFLQEVRATAELTIGLIICLIRNIHGATQQVINGEFNRDEFRGRELYKKTLGIIGFGRLGKIVAEYANAFGMNVIACDHDKKQFQDIRNIQTTDLMSLCQQSDIITLHVDANDANYQMVNETFLQSMKSNAFLVNTSRGSLVDEEALVYALENNVIAGAALDVVQAEPSPKFDGKLFQYQKNNPSRLLITPHIGGNTFESMEKTECFIANKIVDTLSNA